MVKSENRNSLIKEIRKLLDKAILFSMIVKRKTQEDMADSRMSCNLARHVCNILFND